MMEIIKNKEEVKSVMNILQAFADGKTIQAIDPYNDEWCNQTKLNFKALFEGQYRIKPEPKFRPFENAEECWQEMLKHQPFGWVVGRRDGVMYLIRCLEYVSVYTSIQYSFKDAFDKFAFADLVPFGVKIDE